MRGGKNDSKITGPLFPRLHVKDAEKGGPKPPPRNKMALYEQVSIPSQRFTDAPASSLPLPFVYGGTLANVDSSSQVTSPLFTFIISSALHRSNRRQGSCSVDRHLIKTGGNSAKTLSTTHGGNTITTEGPFHNTMSTFQPWSFSHSKRATLLRNEAELGAHHLMLPAVNLDSIDHQSSRNSETCLVSPSFSLQPQSDVNKRPKTCTSAERDSEEHLGLLNGGDLKIQEISQGHDKIVCSLPQAIQEHTENVSSGVHARDAVSSKSLNPTIGVEHSELSNRVPISSDSQRKSCELNETSSVKAWGCMDVDIRANKMSNVDVPEQLKLSALNSSHMLRSDSFHESPLTYNHNTPPNAVGYNSQHEEESEPSSLSANFLKRDGHFSVAPVMHTMSCTFISPDDVVEMMGHTHFWKARRAIINQQRVFSMQVFELHRIIKVQKVLAGSKNLMIEESLFLGKTFTKPSSIRELSQSLVPKNPSALLKSKCDLLKINAVAENQVIKRPHTLSNNEITTLDKRTGHDFGKAAVVPSSLDNKLPRWCLPQLGNQWLVPVMSPSEGLIYKPYTELPCPPPGGFRANIYGSCVPTSTTRSSGELLNSACAHSCPVAPPVGPTYFAPYGSSIMTPAASTPSMEHTGATLVDSDDFSALHQSSCIVATEKVGGLLVSKDGEKPECRASLPKKRTSDDALPLFPTAPTDCSSVLPMPVHSSEPKTQVIKVIPHNPKLASESAARIIQLIQEERKHLCN